MIAKTATAILALTAVLSTATQAFQQDPLAAAQALYAGASYEEALAALAQVPADAPSEIASRSHRYRAFALFALGRTAEAEQAVEAMVRMRPLERLSAGDASPRIETMFAAVRARVLPAVIRDEYKRARAAIDAEDLKAAEPHLQTASRLIAEVRATGDADPTLADLNLVIDGFLGLTRAASRQQAANPSPDPAASQPPPTPTTASPATAPVATLASSRATTVIASPTNRPVEESGATPPAAVTGRSPAAASVIYSNSGPGQVSPPVVVNQAIPALPRTVSEIMRRTSRKSLVLELVINERGDVDDAVVKVPVEPVYDLLVTRAARDWKYRPATVGGRPVKFRHAVSVAFSDR